MTRNISVDGAVQVQVVNPSSKSRIYYLIIWRP